MPMPLRVLILATSILVGAVLVRHITEALQGLPVPRPQMSTQR